MGLLSAPSVQELADAVNRPVGQFTSFASTALSRSALLFQIATGIDTWPGTEPETSLMRDGICLMADAIYLESDNRERRAQPYQSQTLMSWSYTMAVKAVKKGQATGIDMFDLAVSELRGASTSRIASGDTKLFEDDGVFVDSSGQRYVLTPGDVQVDPLGFFFRQDSAPPTNP